MYRVELKVEEKHLLKLYDNYVPNVPCGVESSVGVKDSLCFPPVPNAPCGVERKTLHTWFLTYPLVPNVPCGIERNLIFRIVPRMRTDS